MWGGGGWGGGRGKGEVGGGQIIHLEDGQRKGWRSVESDWVSTEASENYGNCDLGVVRTQGYLSSLPLCPLPVEVTYTAKSCTLSANLSHQPRCVTGCVRGEWATRRQPTSTTTATTRTSTRSRKSCVAMTTTSSSTATTSLSSRRSSTTVARGRHHPPMTAGAGTNQGGRHMTHASTPCRTCAVTGDSTPLITYDSGAMPRRIGLGSAARKTSLLPATPAVVRRGETCRSASWGIYPTVAATATVVGHRGHWLPHPRFTWLAAICSKWRPSTLVMIRHGRRTQSQITARYHGNRHMTGIAIRMVTCRHRPKCSNTVWRGTELSGEFHFGPDAFLFIRIRHR